MDGLQITGPATSALAARVAAEARAAAERSELRSRIAEVIGLCDAVTPRRACPSCGVRNPATEPWCDCGHYMDDPVVEHRSSRWPPGTKCGVCGLPFSADPPYCRFGWDVGNGVYG